jgi:hypothetical protein
MNTELHFRVATPDRSGKILHILHSATESLLDGWYKNIPYTAYLVGADGIPLALDELAKVLRCCGRLLCSVVVFWSAAVFVAVLCRCLLLCFGLFCCRVVPSCYEPST